MPPKVKKWPRGKTAQELQDEIFGKMSPEKKLEVGAQLWRLGKELAGGKIINYGANRHPRSVISRR